MKGYVVYGNTPLNFSLDFRFSHDSFWVFLRLCMHSIGNDRNISLSFLVVR